MIDPDVPAQAPARLTYVSRSTGWPPGGHRAERTTSRSVEVNDVVNEVPPEARKGEGHVFET
jgi:hypothetical protein